MKNPILVPEIRDLLIRKKFKVLQSFVEERHEKEIAEYIQLLRPDEIWAVLNLVDIHRRIEIFGYLDMDVQVELVSGNWRKQISELLAEMPHDDRADLFQHLEKDMADRLMVYLPISERADVIRLTSYQEETAGAIMTTDYATLNENDTSEVAIRKVRRMAPSKETIYYIYVTDDSDKLIGFVSLEKLILARPKQKVKNIMKKEVIIAFIDDDQEYAARLLADYDLLALPVVDRNLKLAGIITYDDAIDILKEEQTEDMEKLMAISGGVEDKTYLQVPAHVHFRKRVFWVVTLGVFGLLTGLIVEVFQKTLETLIILTFYIPLLNAAGGNTGSQSATVVLRALTLKELDFRDIIRVVKKEFVISFFLSICLGGITFFRVYYLTGGTHIPEQFTLMNVSMVIAISLGLQVLWSTIFGAIVPLIATRVKIDPAIVSSPLLTTFVDMGGIIIYFTVARIILGI